MTPSIFIDLDAYASWALDGIVLTPRRVQFAWKTGHLSSHKVRLRDQVRFYIRHLMMDDSLSYGKWANIILDEQL